jgi:tetratricopeptide (TPR) repeat protein
VLREMGHVTEAQEALERAATLDPACAAPHFELGLLANAQGSLALSYRHFSKATELDPAWTGAAAQLGIAAYAIGDDDTAIRALRTATDAGESSLRVVHALALATERRDGPRAALAIFELALVVAPESADAQFDVGRIRAATGQADRALDPFIRAADLRPEWADAWMQVLELARRLGLAPEADRAVSVLASLGRESADWWLSVADLYVSSRAGKGAVRSCFRALALTSEPSPVIKSIGCSLLESGDAASSEALFRGALVRFPEWAGVHFEHGRALEFLGRLNEAEAAYAKASTLRPAWREASRAWARVAGADASVSSAR